MADSTPSPPPPSARVLLPVAVAAVAALAVARGAPAAPAPARTVQPPPAPVRIAGVIEIPVHEEQAFVGTVRPRRRVRFGSGAAGRVVAVLARRGDRVAAEQELVRLRDLPTRLQLEGARRELALRQAEALEASNGPRPEEVAVARARLAATTARLTYDEWALQRAQELYRSETTSEDALRQARLRRDSSRAARDEAAAQLALLKAGTRPERIAQAKARVAAQEEAVKLLEDHLDKLRVRAPFDAFVSVELTEVGAWLEVGAPVIELIDLDEVEIEVAVPEGSTEHVRIGSEVAVGLRSLEGGSVSGKVVAVSPDADPRTRTLPVRIRVTNRITDGQPRIKAGMLADVRLPVGAPRRGLVVPKDALVLGGASPVVYVLAKPPDASGLAPVRVVPVKLAFAVGEGQVVSGPGLAAGTQVVVRGNERLRPGQVVRVQAAPDGDAGKGDKGATRGGEAKRTGR